MQSVTPDGLSYSVAAEALPLLEEEIVHSSVIQELWRWNKTRPTWIASLLCTSSQAAA